VAENPGGRTGRGIGVCAGRSTDGVAHETAIGAEMDFMGYSGAILANAVKELKNP